MEAAAEPQTVDGPSGWLSPQIPAGANILSKSPIAYTLDNLLTGETVPLVVIWLWFPSCARRTLSTRVCRRR